MDGNIIYSSSAGAAITTFLDVVGRTDVSFLAADDVCLYFSTFDGTTHRVEYVTRSAPTGTPTIFQDNTEVAGLDACEPPCQDTMCRKYNPLYTVPFVFATHYSYERDWYWVTGLDLYLVIFFCFCCLFACREGNLCVKYSAVQGSQPRLIWRPGIEFVLLM